MRKYSMLYREANCGMLFVHIINGLPDVTTLIIGTYSHENVAAI